MWKKQLRLFLCSALLRVVLLCALLILPGKTPLWSQTSGPLSRNSGEHLSTWETLSGKFTSGLEQHEQTLRSLGQRLGTSEASLQRLTPLYELSLRQNEALKVYNAQIGERMQERDQDLAAAYEEIDKQGRTIPRLIIAIILLCIPYMVKLGVWVAKKVIGK
jgi:hypothetical protein